MSIWTLAVGHWGWNPQLSTRFAGVSWDFLDGVRPAPTGGWDGRRSNVEGGGTTLRLRPPPQAERHGPAPVPSARGPVSAWLIDQLEGFPKSLGDGPAATDDPLVGDDTHLALTLLYELHYRGVEGVDERWEWHPDLIRVRAGLESRFESALRDEVEPLPQVDDVTAFLQDLTTDDGPSLATHMEEEVDLRQFQEQAIHRAIYQLKEADPHSWAIPRLSGRPKAALVEIQADEYGDGVEADIHAELYALTMERLGLSPAYHAYLDVVPGVTLATVNLVSMFGLHRRLLGAVVGHLAVFEMTSVRTMAHYAGALRQMGFDPWTCLFYDTHVVADAHHQTVAATDLAAGLVEQDPRHLESIVFGATALCALEARLTTHLLESWKRGQTTLLREIELPTVVPGLTEEVLPAEDPRPVAD